MLLAVLTCQSATECVKRHLPNWQRFFNDIVFVTTVDSVCYVPEGYRQIKCGRDYYPDRDNPDDNLPQRTISTLKWFGNDPSERLVLIEYDVVFFHKPILKHDFSGTMFSEMIHPPWCFTKKSAREFAHVGEILLKHKVISGGWPDRHLKLIEDLLQPSLDRSNNFSSNTLDRPDLIAGARADIKNGCWAVHGVKTKEQYEALMA